MHSAEFMMIRYLYQASTISDISFSLSCRAYEQRYLKISLTLTSLSKPILLIAGLLFHKGCPNTVQTVKHLTCLKTYIKTLQNNNEWKQF